MPLLRVSIIALACTWASLGQAATYSVGPGCTHATLQAALTTAASTPSGAAHLVKVLSGEILVADVAVAAPVADIIIEGGYSTCAATTSTGFTTVRKAASPASARLFEFSNPTSEATPRRAIRLRRLTLTGANYTGALGGGAIYAAGKLDLVLQSRVIIEDNQASNGGGIYLLSLAVGAGEARLFLNGGDTTVERPIIRNNRAVGPGTNGNGGGIYALGGAAINILNGRIADNQARRHGGGIAVIGGNARIVMNNVTPLPIEINGNLAGTGGFSDTLGFGGGIYSEGSSISQLTEEMQIVQVGFSGNTANHGGGLYALGSATTRIPLQFRSSSWVNNVARGKGGAIRAIDGVDLEISHQQTGGFCLVAFLPLQCSRMVGNRADNEGTPGTPGGGALHLTSTFGLPPEATARALIQRTIFDGNDDPTGQAAAVHAGARTRLEIEASVFQDNAATTGSGVIDGVGPETLFLRYNTFLDNQTNRLVYSRDQILNIHGSVLWAPPMTLVALIGTASIFHNDCLLASQPLIPSQHVIVAAPRLDTRQRPRGSSPAIDGCDNLGYAPVRDLYYAERGYDVVGVNNVWGNNDLGAVEQRDILMYGGFGAKPTN